MKSWSSSLQNELGAALVFFALSFFGFLAVVGLAVDCGNLYLSQLRLQRTVDAATVRGTNLLMTEPDVAVVRAATMNFVRDNLSQSNLLDLMKFNAGQQAQVNINVLQRRLAVSSNADVPTLILNLLPYNISPSKLVAASATGEAATAAVSLVIDNTGSMNCPAAGTCGRWRCRYWNCNWGRYWDDDYCAFNHGNSYCRNQGPTKLDELKVGAKAFVNLFNESLDEIALVTFNSSAVVQKPMTSPFVKTSLHNIIDSISASNSTNIQAGIVTGQNQLTLASSPIARKVMVLITDGAPNNSDSGSCSGLSSSQKHYVRAIESADAARASGTSFYTIGYGHSNTATDVYQNINDDTSIKSNLLKRLANAESGINDPAFPCVGGFSTYNTNHSGAPHGEYYETPNSNELQDLLVLVGQSIQARLTS